MVCRCSPCASCASAAPGNPGNAARRSANQPGGHAKSSASTPAPLYVANVADSIGDGIAKAAKPSPAVRRCAKLDQFVQCATPGGIIIHIQNSGGDHALPQQNRF